MNKLFDTSEIPEYRSIYYISPEATNIFYPKEDQNLVSTIKRLMIYFSEANNVVTFKDILDTQNVGDTITEAARYNANIRCHYITLMR